MTNGNLFREIAKRNGLKWFEVAGKCGMTTQSLDNKTNNKTEFTQAEMKAFREACPDMTDAEFNAVFFGQQLA